LTAPRFLARLARERRGATAVEFAMLTFPLLGMLMGALEMGYQFYAASMLQGTIYRASRMATLENANQTTIDAYVRTQLKGITAASNIVITSQSYRSFSGVGKPEKITTDVAPIGSYNKGDCFVDANGNGKFDAAQGSSGLGGAEDVVSYTVKMTYKRLLPINKLIKVPGTVQVVRNTILRNEPYAGVIGPATVCT